MRMNRPWITAALPEDPAAPGAGGQGGGGGAPAGNPPAGGGQGDPPQDQPELTWESLAEKGIKDPADVLKVLGDVETWKGHARTWEGRAGENLRKLQEKERAGLPDAEKALAEREDRARAEERRKLAPTLGKAAFVTAAAGKVADVESALELIDPARFVKDDGSVDESAIQDAVAKFVKLGGSTQDGTGGGGKPPTVERGARNGSRPTQVSRSELERMSPEQINTARKEGRLDDLLGITR